MILNNPVDEHFLDTCVDVVIRFKGHHSYKGRKGALKAFARRSPGQNSETYEDWFDFMCSLYDQAVLLIEIHRKPPRGPFAKFEDIDADRCMLDLETKKPGEASKQKRQILDWVIFWHYLK